MIEFKALLRPIHLRSAIRNLEMVTIILDSPPLFFSNQKSFKRQRGNGKEELDKVLFINDCKTIISNKVASLRGKIESKRKVGKETEAKLDSAIKTIKLLEETLLDIKEKPNNKRPRVDSSYHN